jgi:predicted nucleotidyltransferase
VRTKWQILEEQRDKARSILESFEAQLQYLENTKFGGECSYCGLYLETEADFAKHYLVPDERLYNLGNCPQKYEDVMAKAERVGRRI